MGISEIEAFEHSLRQILGEPIPDALFREVADEVERGTLFGCMAQAPNLGSLSASVRYMIQDLDERIAAETDAQETEYLHAVRDKLTELERSFHAAVEPLNDFLTQRVVKGHFRLHDRFPSHSHDA